MQSSPLYAFTLVAVMGITAADAYEKMDHPLPPPRPKDLMTKEVRETPPLKPFTISQGACIEQTEMGTAFKKQGYYALSQYDSLTQTPFGAVKAPLYLLATQGGKEWAMVRKSKDDVCINYIGTALSYNSLSDTFYQRANINSGASSCDAEHKAQLDGLRVQHHEDTMFSGMTHKGEKILFLNASPEKLTGRTSWTVLLDQSQSTDSDGCAMTILASGLRLKHFKSGLIKAFDLYDDESRGNITASMPVLAPHPSAN